jgi:hypothetical protein
MNESVVSTLQFTDYKIKNFVFTLNDNFKSKIQPVVKVHFTNKIIRYDEK